MLSTMTMTTGMTTVLQGGRVTVGSDWSLSLCSLSAGAFCWCWLATRTACSVKKKHNEHGNSNAPCAHGAGQHTDQRASQAHSLALVTVEVVEDASGRLEDARVGAPASGDGPPTFSRPKKVVTIVAPPEDAAHWRVGGSASWGPRSKKAEAWPKSRLGASIASRRRGKEESTRSAGAGGGYYFI